jgi:hypothetical protein
MEQESLHHSALADELSAAREFPGFASLPPRESALAAAIAELPGLRTAPRSALL